ISDAYGRRLTIILGLGVFVLGSVWCAFARDIQELLMARALQGVGAASLIVTDRKSTRLNSSHVKISYAVFCLKKKKSQGLRVAVVDPGHAGVKAAIGLVADEPQVRRAGAAARLQAEAEQPSPKKRLQNARKSV